jgi:DNA-binding NarL/FixJ family response regulator
MGGIEATRSIITTNPDMKILALSMVMDRSCVVESLKAGAKGYLIKNCAAEELLLAIRALSIGESYLCASITELVIRDYTQLTTDDSPTSKEKLSKREQEVLQLIADGKSTKEIAFIHGVSARTVDVQRSTIMKKLDLYSIAKLTKYAVREGLVSIE